MVAVIVRGVAVVIKNSRGNGTTTGIGNIIRKSNGTGNNDENGNSNRNSNSNSNKSNCHSNVDIGTAIVLAVMILDK